MKNIGYGQGIYHPEQVYLINFPEVYKLYDHIEATTGNNIYGFISLQIQIINRCTGCPPVTNARSKLQQGVQLFYHNRRRLEGTPWFNAWLLCTNSVFLLHDLQLRYIDIKFSSFTFFESLFASSLWSTRFSRHFTTFSCVISSGISFLFFLRF